MPWFVPCGSLMEFLPANKQTEAYFTEFFKEKGLADIVTFWKNQVWSGSSRYGLKWLVWSGKRHLWSGRAKVITCRRPDCEPQ